MTLNPPIKRGNLTFNEVKPVYFDNTQTKRLFAIFPPITGKGFVLGEGATYNEEWTTEEAEAIIQAKIDSGEFAELLNAQREIVSIKGAEYSIPFSSGRITP